MTDAKKSADCRKGKKASPWGWYPHVPRRENFQRNREYKLKLKGDSKDE